MDALVGPVTPAWRLGDTLAGLRYCSAGVPKMFRWRRPAEPVTFCFHSTCEGGAGFFNQRSTGPLPARTFLAWTAPRRRDPGETLEGLRCSKEPANRLAEVEYGLKRRGYSGSEGARGRARFVLGHRFGGVASPVCRGLEFGPRKSSWSPCKRCP